MREKETAQKWRCPSRRGRVLLRWEFPNQTSLPFTLGRTRFIKIPPRKTTGTQQPFASLKHVRAGKKDLEALLSIEAPQSTRQEQKVGRAYTQQAGVTSRGF